MPIVAFIAALAAMVWGAVYARRGSLATGCMVLLVVGYVFGHAFWNADLGPLPLTFDRLLLIGLCGMFVVQWQLGRWQPKPICGLDWLVALLVAIVTLSLLLSGSHTAPENAAPPIWRLATSFWMPALLYLFARQAPIDLRVWKKVLTGLACLGVYLAGTALAEVGGQWWAVFPRYIADPELGTHFGRGRGPALNSASLGVYLTACACAAWTLHRQVKGVAKWLLLASLPLMSTGVFFTYTRSTWLGLAASAAVIAWFALPGRYRLPAFATSAALGLLVLLIAWGSIVGLEREGSASESQHSVHQRTAFAYVSWQIFKDHPMFGVGFGNFYQAKLPYLADRTQPFEIESIRELHHHNTFLAMLTETGMIGLAAYVALLAGIGRAGWRLARDANVPAWMRGHGVLMLALLVNYLPTALFHDVTHLPPEQWLLFVAAGLTVSIGQTAVGCPARAELEYPQERLASQPAFG